jgi:hypothetical protein
VNRSTKVRTSLYFLEISDSSTTSALQISRMKSSFHSRTHAINSFLHRLPYGISSINWVKSKSHCD